MKRTKSERRRSRLADEIFKQSGSTEKRHATFTVTRHPSTPEDAPEYHEADIDIEEDDLPATFTDSLFLMRKLSRTPGGTFVFEGKEILTQPDWDAAFQAWKSTAGKRRAKQIDEKIQRAKVLLDDPDGDDEQKLEGVELLWTLDEFPALHFKIIQEVLPQVLNCVVTAKQLKVRTRALGLVYTLSTQAHNVPAILKRNVVPTIVTAIEDLTRRAYSLQQHNKTASSALDETRAIELAKQAEEEARLEAALKEDDEPKGGGGPGGGPGGGNDSDSDEVPTLTQEEEAFDFTKSWASSDEQLLTLFANIHQLALLHSFLAGVVAFLAQTGTGRRELVKQKHNFVPAIRDALATVHVVRTEAEKAIAVSVALRRQMLKKKARIAEVRVQQERAARAGGSSMSLRARRERDAAAHNSAADNLTDKEWMKKVKVLILDLHDASFVRKFKETQFSIIKIISQLVTHKDTAAEALPQLFDHLGLDILEPPEVLLKEIEDKKKRLSQAKLKVTPQRKNATVPYAEPAPGTQAHRIKRKAEFERTPKGGHRTTGPPAQPPAKPQPGSDSSVWGPVAWLEVILDAIATADVAPDDGNDGVAEEAAVCANILSRVCLAPRGCMLLGLPTTLRSLVSAANVLRQAPDPVLIHRREHEKVSRRLIEFKVAGDSDDTTGANEVQRKYQGNAGSGAAAAKSLKTPIAGAHRPGADRRAFVPREGTTRMVIALATAMWAGIAALRELKQPSRAHVRARKFLANTPEHEMRHIMEDVASMLIVMATCPRLRVAQCAMAALAQMATPSARAELSVDVADALPAADALGIAKRWTDRRGRECSISLVAQLLYGGGHMAAMTLADRRGLVTLKALAEYFSPTDASDAVSIPGLSADAAGGSAESTALDDALAHNPLHSPPALADAVYCLMTVSYWAQAGHETFLDASLLRMCVRWVAASSVTRGPVLPYSSLLLFILARQPELRALAVAEGALDVLRSAAQEVTETIEPHSIQDDGVDAASRRHQFKTLELILAAMWILCCPAPPENMVLPDGVAEPDESDGEGADAVAALSGGSPRAAGVFSPSPMSQSGDAAADAAAAAAEAAHAKRVHTANTLRKESSRFLKKMERVASRHGFKSATASPAARDARAHSGGRASTTPGGSGSSRMLAAAGKSPGSGNGGGTDGEIPEAASLFIAELPAVPAVDMLMDVVELQDVSAGIAAHIAMEILWRLISTMSSEAREAVRYHMLDATIIHCLWDIATSLTRPVPLRLLASQLLVELRPKTEDGKRAPLVQEEWAPHSVESLLVSLCHFDEDPHLQAFATHILAELTARHGPRMRLVALGVVETLSVLLEEAMQIQLERKLRVNWGVGADVPPTDSGESAYAGYGEDDDGGRGRFVLADAVLKELLQCLLNLSLEDQCMAAIGKYVLDALLHIMQQAIRWAPLVVEMAKRVMANIAKHPANRTRIYKAELRLNTYEHGAYTGEFAQVTTTRKGTDAYSAAPGSYGFGGSGAVTSAELGEPGQPTRSVDSRSHGQGVSLGSPAFGTSALRPDRVRIQYLEDELKRRATKGRLAARLNLLRIGVSDFEPERARPKKGAKAFGDSQLGSLGAGSEKTPTSATKEEGDKAGPMSAPVSPMARPMTAGPARSRAPLLSHAGGSRRMSDTFGSGLGGDDAGSVIDDEARSASLASPAREIPTNDELMRMHPVAKGMLVTDTDRAMIFADVRRSLTGNKDLYLGALPPFVGTHTSKDAKPGQPMPKSKDGPHGVATAFDKLKWAMTPNEVAREMPLAWERLADLRRVVNLTVAQQWISPAGAGGVLPDTHPMYDAAEAEHKLKEAGVIKTGVAAYNPHFKSKPSLAALSSAGDRVMPAWLAAGINTPKNPEVLPPHTLRHRLSRTASAMWSLTEPPGPGAARMPPEGPLPTPLPSRSPSTFASVSPTPVGTRPPSRTGSKRPKSGGHGRPGTDGTSRPVSRGAASSSAASAESKPAFRGGGAAHGTSTGFGMPRQSSRLDLGAGHGPSSRASAISSYGTPVPAVLLDGLQVGDPDNEGSLLSAPALAYPPTVAELETAMHSFEDGPTGAPITMLAQQEEWEHIPGAKFCEELYEHVDMPDGTSIHFSIPRNPRYEQRGEHIIATRPEPHTLRDIGQDMLPPPPRAVSHAKSDLPPGVLPAKPRLPMWCRNNALFDGHERPATLPLVPPDDPVSMQIWREPPPPPPPAEPEKPKEDPFDLRKSVFAPRAKESQSRGFYDKPKLRNIGFKNDWARVITKSGFSRTLRKECGGDEGKINEIEAILSENYALLSDTFDYFSCRNSDQESFCILMNAFTELVMHCKIPDPNSDPDGKCKLSDIDRLFVLCNYEEKGGDAKQKEDNKHNLDRALMRFEYVEMIVRMAMAKFENSEVDPVIAVRRLLDEHIVPNCKDLAHDRNSFRKERLYTRPVNDFYKTIYPQVRNLHKQYCPLKVGSSEKASRSSLDKFLQFLAEASLLDDTFTVREARLAFSWSRMRETDELRHRDRQTTITLTDFLELLGRVADMKWLPSKTQLMQAGIRDFDVYRYFRDGWHIAARRAAEAESAVDDGAAQARWKDLKAMANVTGAVTATLKDAVRHAGEGDIETSDTADARAGILDDSEAAMKKDKSFRRRSGVVREELAAAAGAGAEAHDHAGHEIITGAIITRDPSEPLEDRIAKLWNLLTKNIEVRHLKETGNWDEAEGL